MSSKTRSISCPNDALCNKSTLPSPSNLLEAKEFENCVTKEVCRKIRKVYSQTSLLMILLTPFIGFMVFCMSDSNNPAYVGKTLSLVLSIQIAMPNIANLLFSAVIIIFFIKVFMHFQMASMGGLEGKTSNLIVIPIAFIWVTAFAMLYLAFLSPVNSVGRAIFFEVLVFTTWFFNL